MFRSSEQPKPFASNASRRLRRRVCLPCIAKQGHYFSEGPGCQPMRKPRHRHVLDIVTAFQMEGSGGIHLESLGLIFCVASSIRLDIPTIYLYVPWLEQGAHVLSAGEARVRVVNVTGQMFDDEVIVWVGDFSHLVDTHSGLLELDLPAAGRLIKELPISLEAYFSVGEHLQGFEEGAFRLA